MDITYKIKCLKGKNSGKVIPVKTDLETIEDDGLAMTLIRLGLFDSVTFSNEYFEVLEREVHSE